LKDRSIKRGLTQCCLSAGLSARNLSEGGSFSVGRSINVKGVPPRTSGSGCAGLRFASAPIHRGWLTPPLPSLTRVGYNATRQLLVLTGAKRNVRIVHYPLSIVHYQLIA